MEALATCGLGSVVILVVMLTKLRRQSQIPKAKLKLWKELRPPKQMRSERKQFELVL